MCPWNGKITERPHPHPELNPKPSGADLPTPMDDEEASIPHGKRDEEDDEEEEDDDDEEEEEEEETSDAIGAKDSPGSEGSGSEIAKKNMTEVWRRGTKSAQSQHSQLSSLPSSLSHLLMLITLIRVCRRTGRREQRTCDCDDVEEGQASLRQDAARPRTEGREGRRPEEEASFI